ncbi:hypothetical protein [Pelagerythrobacter marensis]|uniref:Uncharacterized protein n=1 Tax=Pelagerythrobacter marensis TaxID=543877 RepID=A0A0G3X6A9_9SPHN|nr:hypothetical protein [Pelagerythrobacter marensis]AKM06129.1 hypothetical protein AM2010_35 [Pelagerythrobacter marensis]
MNAPTTTPVAAKAAKNDIAISIAWKRYRKARLSYNALPLDDGPVVGMHTPAELEQINAMDAAESVLQASLATTPEDIELILWLAILHMVGRRDDDTAACNCDLRYFLDRETDFDWNVRLILTAIRSLRELGEVS